MFSTDTKQFRSHHPIRVLVAFCTLRIRISARRRSRSDLLRTNKEGPTREEEGERKALNGSNFPPSSSAALRRARRRRRNSHAPTAASGDRALARPLSRGRHAPSLASRESGDTFSRAAQLIGRQEAATHAGGKEAQGAHAPSPRTRSLGPGAERPRRDLLARTGGMRTRQRLSQ